MMHVSKGCTYPAHQLFSKVLMRPAIDTCTSNPAATCSTIVRQKQFLTQGPRFQVACMRKLCDERWAPCETSAVLSSQPCYQKGRGCKMQVALKTDMHGCMATRKAWTHSGLSSARSLAWSSFGQLLGAPLAAGPCPAIPVAHRRLRGCLLVQNAPLRVDVILVHAFWRPALVGDSMLSCKLCQMLLVLLNLFCRRVMA